MHKAFTYSFILCIILLIGVKPAACQNEKCKLKTTLSTDLVSSYIWRGTVSDQSPNIQPSLSASLGNFSLGTWASTNFTGSYKEVDLFASYTFSHITLTLNDYQWSPFIDGTPYFEYNNDKTGHILEGALAFTGGEKFPLKASVNTMFYGADKKMKSDSSFVNQYSTYIELLYPFQWNGNTVDVFAGFTPDKGYYGNGAGVVNFGCTGYKTIKLSDSFSLPLKGSLIFNPQASRVFFVLALTL